MKKFKLVLLSLIVFLISGCSTKVSQIGGDNLYMAYSTGAGFNPASEVQNVNEAAIKFAKEKDMTMIPIDLKIQQGILGSTPPSATLQFKLVPHNSVEAKNKDNDSLGINKLEVSNKKDKNNSLEKKLNDVKELLEKGLINQEEYEKMRKNIINNPS